MRIVVWLMIVGLSAVIHAGPVRAEDAPAGGTAGEATGGTRQLPGQVQKDGGDAVKKDPGMGGTAPAPREPSKDNPDDAGDADDDEADQ